MSLTVTSGSRNVRGRFFFKYIHYDNVIYKILTISCEREHLASHSKILVHGYEKVKSLQAPKL